MWSPVIREPASSIVNLFIPFSILKSFIWILVTNCPYSFFFQFTSESTQPSPMILNCNKQDLAEVHSGLRWNLDLLGLTGSIVFEHVCALALTDRRNSTKKNKQQTYKAIQKRIKLHPTNIVLSEWIRQ